MSDTEEQENKNLQLKEDKPFITFWKALPKKTDDLIRFFDRKGYYSLHGDDAVLIAQIHFNSTKALKHWNNDFAYITIRDGMEFTSVLGNLLFKRNMRVEVYTKADRGDWSLARRGSPGNLEAFEDVLWTNTGMRESSMIIAIKSGNEEKGRSVGVAFADATLRKIGVSQFTDTEQYTNLESFVLQIGAKECLLFEEKTYDYKKICDVLDRCNVLKVVRPRGEFDPKNIEQDLTTLLGSVQNHLTELEQKFAMGALSGLICYLDLLSTNTNAEGKYKLERFALADYMRLDSSAFRALNLTPALGQTGASDQGGMTLFSMLNKCCTAMGSRRLFQWVKQPLLNLEEITRRQDFVEAFYDDASCRESLRGNALKKIGDCARISKLMMSKKANLEHCITMYNVVCRIPDVIQALSDYDGPHKEAINTTFIQQLNQLNADFEQFRNMCVNTIDLPKADSHEYNILPSFSKPLQDLAEQKAKVEETLEELRIEAASKLKLEDNKVKMDSNSQIGHFLRIARKDDHLLRENKAFDVIETRKDGVRFRSPKMKKASDAYANLKQEYEAKQLQFVTKIIDIVLSYVPRLEDLGNLLADLDVFVNLAHVAATAPSVYVRPTMKEMGSGILELRDSRHPCVEAQDGLSFISNDAVLSTDRRFHIITGPNMGGKSTYIRQIGIIVLMAQIGCYVPCSSAIISIVDCILARVGASDSQLHGISTFMAEMLETAAILRSATKDSLIIIDELGRGTSTYDGFGIAWAISKHICESVRAFCLFATHFHELTTLANQIEGVVNLHVTAQTTNDSLSLLYKVEDGACDQSFGIHVAQLAHFPKAVVDAARAKAEELEDFEGDGIDLTNSGENAAALKEFMEKFVKLPLDTLGAKEGIAAVRNLINEASPRLSVLGKRKLEQ